LSKIKTILENQSIAEIDQLNSDLLELIKQRSVVDIGTYGYYVHGWAPYFTHIRTITRALNAMERGHDGDRYVIVVAPPQHGKTNWSSIALSSWYLGRHPDRHVLHICATDDQALLNSTAIKDTVQASSRFREIFPRAQLDGLKPQGGATWFLQRKELGDKDPSFAAYGSGSKKILGRGTQMLIVDDPCDEENTGTKYQRDKLWDWFNSKVLSRLHPVLGRAIIIMHRWHDEDLVGKLLKTEGNVKDGGRWKLISMKAVQDDGTALWPEFQPLDALMRARARNPLIFESLWQGNPSALAGQIIHGDTLQDVPGDFHPVRACMGIDLAISQRESADYTVIAGVALDKDNRGAVMLMRRGRWGFMEQINQVVTAYDEFNAILRPWEVKVELVGVESVQYQKAMADFLNARSLLPVYEVGVMKDKVSRARPWIARAETGNFFVSHKVDLWPDFLSEAVAFGGTRTEHDDMIDAVSAAWQTLEYSGTSGIMVV